MSGSVQELMAQAREMLASRGAPVTTDNLNRAMLMLSGTSDTRTEQTAEGFDMNAQVDRLINRSTPQRANVPRNTQPSAPVGVDGQTAAPPSNEPALPMPAPDVREAAQQAGQREAIIPGEGTMYVPEGPAPASSLDGNGMQNRLMRDLVMGAEAAGATTGTMPQVGAAYLSRLGLPNIRLGINRPQIAGPAGNAAQLGDDAAGAAVSAAPRPTLPSSGGAQARLPAPQQAIAAPPAPTQAPLGPMQQQALRGPELGPMQQQALRGPELGPMQQQALRGPELGRMQQQALRGPELGPMQQAARAGAKPRNMSQAQRQRRQNIAESQ